MPWLLSVLILPLGYSPAYDKSGFPESKSQLADACHQSF